MTNFIGTSPVSRSGHGPIISHCTHENTAVVNTVSLHQNSFGDHNFMRIYRNTHLRKLRDPDIRDLKFHSVVAIFFIMVMRIDKISRLSVEFVPKFWTVQYWHS